MSEVANMLRRVRESINSMLEYLEKPSNQVSEPSGIQVQLVQLGVDLIRRSNLALMDRQVEPYRLSERTTRRHSGYSEIVRQGYDAYLGDKCIGFITTTWSMASKTRKVCHVSLFPLDSTGRFSNFSVSYEEPVKNPENFLADAQKFLRHIVTEKVGYEFCPCCGKKT